MKKLILLISILSFLSAGELNKVYKVVVLTDWKPYYFINKNNKPDGYAIELFEKIASNIGVKYEYVVVDTWKEAIELIAQKKVDISPNVGITKTRENIYSFSTPTDFFEISLYKNKKVKDNDLKTKKVGVIINNVCRQLIKEDMCKTKKIFDNYHHALAQLVDNKIDVLCFPKNLVNQSIKELNIKNIELFGKPLKVIPRGIGVVKEEKKILDLIDKEILKLKGNGEYQKIYNKWFGEHKDIEIDIEQLLVIILMVVLLVILIVFYLHKRKWVMTKNELEEMVKHQTKDIENSQKLLDSVINGIDDFIFYKDENLNYLGCNDAYANFIGLEKDKIIGKNDLDIFDEESARDIINIKVKKSVVNKVKTENGDDLVISSNWHPFYYGEDKCGVLVISRDITELYKIQKQLKAQTYIDELTKINNRKSYNERIEELIAEYKRYDVEFSMIMFDIDFFKLVNDNYGHHIGDEVLIHLAKLVKSYIREGDYFFRVGGEEFIILLKHTHINEATKFAENIRKKVENELNIIDDKKITISLGVTEVRKDDSVKTLYKRVDKCLYSAKNSGRNRVVYNDEN